MCDADRDFLLRLYSSTREEELAQVAWSVEEKATFLLQQFVAQSAWWEEQYVGSTFDIIEVDGLAAGRLYVHRAPSEHRIVDIALLPEYRGRGIGTQLLTGVIAEADCAARSVSIHVEVFNPARRLYDRLGFVQIEDKGVYLLMERAPHT